MEVPFLLFLVLSSVTLSAATALVPLFVILTAYFSAGRISVLPLPVIPSGCDRGASPKGKVSV